MPDLRVSFPRPCDADWETMAPSGCDRVCARCDTVIHDLSNYDFDEAEALLRRNGKTCVRAGIGADGAVALKPGGMRRMVIAGATAGLLAAGASACTDQPKGVIAGRAHTTVNGVSVIATGPDGKSFRADVKANGEYRIVHVPAGTYKLSFETACGESGKVEKAVVVGNGEAIVPYYAEEVGCYGLGQLAIENGMV